MDETDNSGTVPEEASADVKEATGATANTGAVGVSGTAGGEGILLMPRGYTITMPEEDDFYVIREEQLNILAVGGKTLAFEIGLFCGGVAAGFAPSFISICKMIQDKKTLATGDYFTGALFIVFLVLAVAKLFEHFWTRTKVDNLVTKIKTGQKMKVNSSATH